MGCAAIAYAQAPSDVPTDHWAYEAINQLASKGYVIGYPDGMFHGDKSMTRYEFASIVKRILDETNKRLSEIQAAADAAKATAEANSNSNTTTVTPTVTPAVPEVTKDDLETIQKLVNEFKGELVVIGTRLDNMDATLEEFKTKLETLNAIITDPEGAFETAKTDVATLKKVTVSGYLQMLYNNFAVAPSGTTTRSETFQLRRARFKITGKGSANGTFVAEVDGGGTSVAMRDVYMQYAFAGDPAVGYTLFAGQMIIPFGNELAVSSSLRETPEYSRVVQKFFPGERDRGFKLASPTGNKIRWQAGVFNGVGTNIEPDINTQKDVAGNIKISLGDLDLGISGYKGLGISDGSATAVKYPKQDKYRFGADMQFYMPNMTFKAEWMRGKGVEKQTRDFNEQITGYWGQISRNIDIKNTIFVKYEGMSDDPTGKDYGKISAWNYGLVHYLDDRNRVHLIYQVNKEAKNSFSNNGFIADFVTIF